MPNTFHLQWRALAMLVALLLVFLLWPINCTGFPITSSKNLLQNNSDDVISSQLSDLKFVNSTMNLLIQQKINVNRINLLKKKRKKITKITENTIRKIRNKSVLKNVSNFNLINNQSISSSSSFNESTTEISPPPTTSATTSSVFETTVQEYFTGLTTPTELPQVILSRTDRSLGNKKRQRNPHLDRNERSANLSHHMSSSARRKQLLIKNHYLQILPDGTISGTTDRNSEFSEFLFLLLYIYF